MARKKNTPAAVEAKPGVELHNCYFCLSEVAIADIGEGHVRRYAVECKNCLACGPFAIDWFRAAMAWNRAKAFEANAEKVRMLLAKLEQFEGEEAQTNAFVETNANCG